MFFTNIINMLKQSFKGDIMGRRSWDQFDKESDKEGRAIAEMNKMRVRTPHLRKYYRTDEGKVLTGQKHRNGGHYGT